MEDPRFEPLLHKPPIMRRSTLRMLSGIALLVIVYGTLGPLGNFGGPWLDTTRPWQWLLTWSAPDRNDFFTNLLVYLPVGLSLRLLLRRRGQPAAVDFTFAWIGALGLSYGTELLQQWQPARSANLADFFVNGGAAFLGCLCAPVVQRWLRSSHAAAYPLARTESWTLLTLATAAVTAGLMLMPLDLRWTAAEFQLTRPLDIEDLRRFGMFTIVGFCAGAAAIQRRGNTPEAVRASLGFVAAVAIGLESLQLFVTSHACGILDMGVATFGGITGIAVATKAAELRLVCSAASRQQPDHWRYRRFVQAAAVLGTLLCLLIFGGRRVGAAVTMTNDDPVIRLVPFQQEFMQPFHRAVSDMAEAVAVYAFLTLFCLLLKRARGRAISLSLVLGVSGSIEGLRAISGTSPADVTAPILAFTGWFLMSRVWSALRPARQHGARSERRPYASLPAGTAT